MVLVPEIIPPKRSVCVLSNPTDLRRCGQGQGAVVRVGGFWGGSTGPMVPSPHPAGRRAKGPAAVLEVALVLHLPPHGGVPVVLDGVVCPVVGEGKGE